MKDLDRDAFNSLLSGVVVDLPEKQEKIITEKTGFDTDGNPLDDNAITQLAKDRDEFWQIKKAQVQKFMEGGLLSEDAKPHSVIAFWIDDDNGLSLSNYNLALPQLIFQLDLLKHNLLNKAFKG